VSVVLPGSGGFLDQAVKLVQGWDASRPRSQQAEPGWSEVGGCRSHLGFRLSGAWASDEPDNWGAVRGTAIHKFMEEVLAGVPGMRTEVTTSYRGIPGHADLIVIDENSVTDHKTTKLANSNLWREKPSALLQKRIQAHGYAAGLIEAGELPETAVVRLLVIPVDGSFADWWSWEEPFDRALADEGADRLEWVRARLEAGEPLPKDEPYQFCASWCPFFSQCRPQDEPDARELISDPELAAAVESYGEAAEQATRLDKEKKRLATLIRGLRGTTGAWRVSLSKPGEPGTALDEDWIRADYAARGEQVPEVTTPGSTPRLAVTRIKKAAA
jgi:hypothetical protein